MPSITVQPGGQVVNAAGGISLLAALSPAGLAPTVKCGGNASCGGCHVFVLEGRKSVSRLSPAENAKLDTMVGVSSKSRLACQVLLGDDPIVVEWPGALSG